MAILRVEEIRKMSRADRSARLVQLKAELLQMNATKAMGGSLENPARIRLLRKTIAKILTINREEDLGIRAPAAEEKPKEEKGMKGEAKAEGEVKEKDMEKEKGKKEEARARKTKKGKETEKPEEEKGKEGESD